MIELNKKKNTIAIGPPIWEGLTTGCATLIEKEYLRAKSSSKGEKTEIKLKWKMRYSEIELKERGKGNWGRGGDPKIIVLPLPKYPYGERRGHRKEDNNA